MERGKWVGKVVMIGLIGIALIFGLITLTQYLWNWLVPALFAGPLITFWQTAGLLLLSKIFLWTFGRNRCHGSHAGGPWKHYWKEKWGGMSPEERERIKQKMKEKWCYREPTDVDVKSGTSND